MSKKVLAIIGSPRKNGNTDQLTDIILESARQSGAQTEKVYLGDLNIKYCIECLHCHHVDPKLCAITDDDMPALVDKMNDADVWVLATPIFWWGPTGQFKTFMDRWYGYVLDFKSKKIIVAYPSGDPDKEVARFLRGMLTDSFAYNGAQAYAWVQAAGANDPGDLAGLPEVIAYAKQVGMDCVK